MIEIILIAVLSLLAQLVLPWWSLAVVAFVICFWRSPSGWPIIFIRFCGRGPCLAIYASIIHVRTDGVFTGRMSELLFKTNTVLLFLNCVTAWLVDW